MTNPSDDPRALLRATLDTAARRWRREWLGQTLGKLGVVLAVGFGGWALLAAAFPEAARPWLVGAAVAGGAVALVVAESRLRDPDWTRLRQRVDAKLGLSDAVLTAAELQEKADAGPTASPWVARQLAQTAASLRGVDWRQVWPVRPARTILPLYLVAALAASFLGWRFAGWRARATPPPATAREHAVAQTLREMFDDWDKSQHEQPDPELKKLLEELRPVRERLAQKDAALGEREAFKLLSNVEEKLAAIRAKLDAQSLQPMAAELAAALDGVNGLGSLAAAVRRGDFEQAEAYAEAAARQMQAPGVPPPPSAPGAETAPKLDQLARQFAQQGNESGQQSMSQMKNGLQQRQASELGKGLGGLKQSLASQNARDGRKRGLALQMRQAGECKNGLGNKDGLAGLSLLPKRSTLRSQLPGKGADRSTDPNRHGAATALAADRSQENLGGSANENGESDTENLSTLDTIQKRAGKASAANYRAYEAMSQQAVVDENLPLAHRQTIKRYFESIRPPEGK